MARIPLFPQDNMSEAQQRVHDAIVSGPRGALVGPLRAALHRPELADKWQQLGAILRYGTSLPPRLSELAILVTARHWSSQLEWQQHQPVAVKGGLSPAVTDAIRDGQKPAFANADEEAVYGYCLELHRSRKVCAENYQRALDCIGVLGVVELTALIGYYTMVAMTLIAHEIPLPEGTSPPLPLRES